MLSDDSAITPLKDRIPLGNSGGAWQTYVPLSQAVILTNEQVYHALHSEKYGDIRLGSLEHILAQRKKRVIARLRIESRSPIIGNRFLGTAIVLTPTTDCHLRCCYCFAAAGSNPENVAVRMNVATAEAALRTVCRNAALLAVNGNKVTPCVSFIGAGEPTFDWHLFTTMVEKARACSRKYSVPLSLSLTSNGYLSEDKALWIANKLDHVAVSFDGPPDVQDIQRPLPGGGSSSGIVSRTLNILCNSRVSTDVCCVVTALGVTRGKEIVAYICEHFPGLEHIVLNPAASVPGGRSLFLPPEPADFVVFLKEAVQTAIDIGFAGHLASAFMISKVRAFFCAASRGRKCYITPYGEVTSCEQTIDARHPCWETSHLGSVSIGKQTLELDLQCVQKAIVEHSIPNFSRPECEQCIARWQCGGGCRISRWIDGLDMWCSIVQPVTKWLLSFLVERAEIDGRVLDNGLNTEDGRDEGVWGAVGIPDVPV